MSHWARLPPLASRKDVLDRFMHPQRMRRAFALLGCVVVTAACVPVEPQPPEPNRPPHIDSDRVTPEGRVTRLGDTDDPTIDLSVDVLLDPNREDTLFYAWYGSADERALFSVGELDRTGAPENANDQFYRFEGVSQTIDACDVVGQANSQQSETIWLFVTDRSFQSATPDSFQLRDGAFVDSWAWVLEYAPGLSNQCAQ